MSDPIDIASEREEIEREHAKAFKKPEGPEPTGRCLYCDRPFKLMPRRWCDADCRDAWEGERRGRR